MSHFWPHTGAPAPHQSYNPATFQAYDSEEGALSSAPTREYVPGTNPAVQSGCAVRTHRSRASEERRSGRRDSRYVKKQATTARSPEDERTLDLRGRRLLVVDDDEGARGWLAEVFSHVGCQVQQASSGLGALDQLAENGPFHLVITDVYMPSPSGLQLVAMARTTGYEGPFLLVTAFPDPEMMEFTVDSENTELLSKPFTADEILDCAANLLDSPLRG